MKFKLDENLPVELVVDLQILGHEAETVVSEGLTGATDAALMGRVRDEGLIFFTLDKGIADLRIYPPADYPGMVLFRPSRSGRGEVLAFVRNHLSSVVDLDLAGRLAVVSERSIRIR